jgi:hypothetical protein
VTRLAAWSLALCVALALADLALGGGHVPPGAFAAFGLAGGVGLAIVAKSLATLGLQHPAPPAGDTVEIDE